MSFVKLENLNDFIQPSTACVKPAEKRTPGFVARVTEVNLTDCLACSGCITSAESVLVQQQNYDELFKVINDKKVAKSPLTVVVSLSLQSIASLANKYNIGAQETAERLASFFISLGCDKVYDINLARHLSLVETIREFRKLKSSGSNLPIISSICPGWICYAEKTNGNVIIPHLSRVRSPQQIMGFLLKRNSHERGVTDGGMYHVTLMPCFDKKLEASRKDFQDEDGVKDVDCVLTPVELEEILHSEGVTLSDFEPRKLDVLVETGLDFDRPLSSHYGSLSGGYAENILLSEARDSDGTNCDKTIGDIKYSTLRNNDFIELSLNGSDESQVNNRLPKIAIVNGFRNIQTVVQRLKRKALKYDFIEIMACPGGCINGGAQCKPSDGEDQASSTESAKKLYKEVPCIKVEDNSVEKEQLYKKLDLLDNQTEKTLYTNFHPVPKMENFTVNW